MAWRPRPGVPQKRPAVPRPRPTSSVRTSGRRAIVGPEVGATGARFSPAAPQRVTPPLCTRASPGMTCSATRDGKSATDAASSVLTSVATDEHHRGEQQTRRRSQANARRRAGTIAVTSTARARAASANIGRAVSVHLPAHPRAAVPPHSPDGRRVSIALSMNGQGQVRQWTAHRRKRPDQRGHDAPRSDACDHNQGVREHRAATSRTVAPATGRGSHHPCSSKPRHRARTRSSSPDHLGGLMPFCRDQALRCEQHRHGDHRASSEVLSLFLLPALAVPRGRSGPRATVCELVRGQPRRIRFADQR